jgi:hypothetical protein
MIEELLPFLMFFFIVCIAAAIGSWLASRIEAMQARKAAKKSQQLRR